MFSDCYKAELYIHKLPEKLSTCYAAFNNCYKAVINLDELTANAPAKGWSKGVNIGYMFWDAGSGNSPGTVTGSRSAFLAKLPNATYTTTAFYGTNTTE